MYGFVKIRRGIEEHLMAGALGLFEFGVYTTVHLQADYRTGVWTGSAPRLLASAPRGAKLRDIQRALKRLEEIEFIRVFHTQGRRGNYHVMLNKFESSSPGLKGKRLNAFKSFNWREPVFEDCVDDDADDGTDIGADGDALTAPYQEVRSKEEEKPKISSAEKAHTRARAFRTKLPAPDNEPLFSKFWNDYPRKIHRRETTASWNALGELERFAAAEALAAFKASSQWLDEGGKYIPSPHKFLDDRRWEHHPTTAEKGQNYAGGTKLRRTHGVNSQRGTDFAAGRTNLSEL